MSREGFPQVRPLQAGDVQAVHAVFHETVALGRPLPFALPGAAAYARLCLGWYLGPGRDDAAVLVHGGAVVGYALVCTDEAAHRRWAVRAALRWAAAAGADVASGQVRGRAATFVRLRCADGYALWRAAGPALPPAHAHVKVGRGARTGRPGLQLVAHVDQRCRRAGLGSWYGEVNAPAGRRVAGLQRLGVVAHRTPNRTLSWLAGEPVERLAFVRDVTRPLPPSLVGRAPAG